MTPKNTTQRLANASAYMVRRYFRGRCASCPAPLRDTNPQTGGLFHNCRPCRVRAAASRKAKYVPRRPRTR